MERIVFEDGSEIETKIIDNPEQVKPILTKEGLRIFKALREPQYPAQLAKELGINEQKIYYYVRQLKNAGLIEVEKTEERQGALAKYYITKIDSFSLVPEKDAGKRNKIMKRKVKGDAEKFLEEFTKKGIFNAKIVVGSPDPHGPYKARARDGHLAAELSAFIGANCSGFNLPMIFLDTMVMDLKNENSNLVVLGGPVTNKIAGQVNKYLPVKFSSSNGNWSLVSGESGKEYIDDSIGVIEKIKHPYFRGKWILLVAGKRNAGTIASILALAKKTTKTVKSGIGEKRFARVVEGVDLDGDGLIDDVEFRE